MMRRFTIIMCLIVILATSSSAFAAKIELMQNSNSTTSQQLMDFYGLQSVDSVPEGVVPIVVHSDEELKKIFDAMKNIAIVHVPFASEASADASFQSTGTHWVTATTAVQIPNVFGWMYVNLHAHIQIYSHLSFRGIIDSQQFTFLSGSTLGYGWTQTYAYANNYGTHINVYGGGVLDFYFIFQGGIKWHSMPLNLSLTYALYPINLR